MNLKAKIAISLVALLVAFSFGRYTGATKIKTEEKQVQNDTKVKKDKESSDVHKKETTKTISKVLPDGTRETETTTTKDYSKDTKSNSSDSEREYKSSEQSKEVTRSGSTMTLSALAGGKVSFSEPITPVYGGMVSKQFIGPISGGVFGFSNGLAGVSVGVSF